MSNFNLNDKKHGDITKKHWAVRTADGTSKEELKFLPIFEVKELPEGTEYAGGLAKEVECRYVEVKVPDRRGNELMFLMNFSDLFLFVYTCAEEELRQQLQMRWERKSTSIPYEVTFKLSPSEVEQKMAKRLITLSVDEITLAIARAGANKLLKNLKPESVEEYVHKKLVALKSKK